MAAPAQALKRDRNRPNGADHRRAVGEVPLRRRDRGRLAKKQIQFGSIAGSLYGDGPKPIDPRQGFIGDCYLLSALAAYAGAGADRIESMIKANRDDTYTLRFYRRLGNHTYEPESVTVDSRIPVTTKDKRCLYARTLLDQQGRMKLWPLIAEKAYAAWKGGYHVIGEGGAVEDVLEELTGQPSRLFYVAEHHPEFLWRLLAQATREKWPTGVCTYGRKERPGLDELGFHPNHIVVFLGVHTLRGRRIIWLRDPFDKPSLGSLNLPDPHGVYTLSWENFLTYFSEILINSSAAQVLTAPPYPSIKIGESLAQSYVFRDLAGDVRRQIAKDFSRIKVPAQARVFAENSEPDAYYIIQSGSIRVEAHDQDANKKRLLAVLSAGDQFGEMAILNQAKRSADVSAIRDLVLYRMPATKFLEWTNRYPELVARFRRRFELQVWMNQWSKRPITSVSLDTLLAAGAEERHPADTVIIRQGDMAECFYLILEGRVQAFTTLPDGSERELRMLEAGDLFGEVAALKRIARSASVRALTNVRLLRLDLHRAADVMENFEVLQRQLEFIARRRSKRLKGRHLNH